jgi:hypothetical protein
METQQNVLVHWERRFLLAILILALTGVSGCAELEKLDFADAMQISGKWVGSYTCAQGVTGLTVTMTGSMTSQVIATFEFYPLPQNPRIASGKYNMKGSYSMGALVLSGSSWINQPAGYRMVGLDGRITSNGKVFSGNIPECRQSFQLEKASA